MKVVSTVRFGWSAGSIARRQVASWAAANPGPWMLIRGAWWLLVHPFHTLGIALATWLWIRGWWPPLAIAAGAVLPTVWASRGLLRILTPPTGGWGTHRRILTSIKRWRTLRRQWQIAALNAGITNNKTEGVVPKLIRPHATAAGIAASIACGRVGVTADKVAQSAEVLAASIPGCRKVTVTPGVTPGWASLHFMWADPLGRTVPLKALPVPPRDRLAFGITEDDEPAIVHRQLSLLVTGISGSGKSTVLWALLASALATGVPFRLWVIDPSGGVELHALKDSPLARMYADRVGTAAGKGNGKRNGGSVPPQPDTANKVIAAAHAAMFARLETMSGTTRLHKPTKAEPLEILVIDEMLRLSHSLTPVARAQLNEILSIGRKAAFVVWALAQLTAKVDLGTVGAARDLFPQRLCLATPNRAATDAILGDGAEAAGAKCSRIRQSQQGIGYAAIDGISGFTRFRGVWVPDAATYQIAKGHLPGRVQQADTIRVEQLSDQEHVMYGWYGPDGDLLYIGISNDGPRRAMEHVRDKDWAREPGVSMRVLERFDDRAAALEAEQRAIKELHPRYNMVHRRERPALPPGPSVDGGL